MHRRPLASVAASDTAGEAWSWPLPAASLLALAADWVWEMDAQLRLVRMARVDGGPLPADIEQALGRAPWDSPVFEASPGHWRRHRRVLWTHKPFSGLELGWRSGARTARWYAISGLPRFDGHGHFTGFVGVAQDITARKRSERALREARSELAATLHALPDLMFELDADGVFHHVHAPQPQLLLVPRPAIVGRRLSDLLPPQALSVARAALEQAGRVGQAHGYRYALDLASGRRWFELSVARKRGDGTAPARFIALVRDITELKRREAELSELAFYDALTGLPNRRLLLDRIEQVLLRQQRRSSWCALLFVDLDDFKRINDTYGHATGDAVLTMVAQRLRSLIRDTDPLGRLAGDEFVALIADLDTDATRAAQIAQRLALHLLRVLNAPADVSQRRIGLSASAGVLMFRGHHPLAELLDGADRLMYQAKGDGKGRFHLRWHGRGRDEPEGPAS